MSNVVVPLREPSPEPAPRPLLGPATVIRVGPADVEVRLRSGAPARARLALAFTYEPAEGDVVLVIGDEAQGHYVIGVLQGRGRASLELPGDVEVRAVGGVLRLAGDNGVEIAAPDVGIEARSLRVLAGAVVQRFASLRQRVSELLHVHAGQSHTVVDGAAHTQARSAAILTEEKMTLNGKAIHLG
ncbi:hypothetical protein BE21_44000 [Sorangium cellulosum]|uniref:DUF3540 domain-containing protein n=1 Tax=Sorangium cellulosum TaxID=56 RepID=A0A150TJM7_SORCE|nr:hypothetical protein BE21_44000 [Sorangium cellulosum]